MSQLLGDSGKRTVSELEITKTPPSVHTIVINQHPSQYSHDMSRLVPHLDTAAPPAPTNTDSLPIELSLETFFGKRIRVSEKGEKPHLRTWYEYCLPGHGLVC